MPAAPVLPVAHPPPGSANAVGPPVAAAHEVPSLMQQQQHLFTPLQYARVVTDGGTGFFRESGDIAALQHDSTSLIPAPKNRRVLVIAISASLEVIAGIVLLVALTRGDDEPDKPDDNTVAPSTPDAKQVAETLADASVAPKATVDAASAPPPPPAECFADVSTVPTGAEIQLGTNVLGTSPMKVPLPCGEQAKLTLRKARFAPVTRTVTPTENGAKLKVALPKQLFSVKVSSQPAGAAVMLNGKSLGVTPTTVKLPAFEASTLTLNKEGFNSETLRVTPKQNNQAVQAQLKKKKKGQR
jgi:hypothetical protein